MTAKILRKIVVPTDFSKLSFAAIDYVTASFELEESKIYLLHVLDKIPPNKTKKVKKSSEKNSRDDEKEAIKKMNGIASQYLSECGKVEKLIRRGDSYREIVKLAQEEDVDIIVISTHGRTGILHALMGSVAEKVIRYSTVPVLTVKHEKVQMKLMEQEDVDEQLHLRLKV